MNKEIMFLLLAIFYFISSVVFASQDVNSFPLQIEKLVSNGEYDKAINQLTDEINKNHSEKSVCELRSYLGKVFYKKNELKNALNTFSEAINADPYCLEAYNGRGFLLNGMSGGDLSKALADLNMAIEMSPTFAKAYYNRAYTNYLLGFYGKSWNDVNMAQDLGYEGKIAFNSEIENLVKIKNGFYKDFYSSGKIRNRNYFQDGKFNGVQFSYFENGYIKEKSNFRHGVANGKSVFYSEDGKVEGVFMYKDGKRNGVTKIYYPNGKMMYEIHYRDGKEAGMVKLFSDNGSLIQELSWMDGLHVMKAKFYDYNGKRLCETLKKYNQDANCGDEFK
ncbi:MAG: tetratricopeptide repeat protein [Candidatus Omnitrophica bacterium]|nr:tetratricopeptide repeat protein [Candidatus Omnitrophota bacterium]